MRSCFPPNAFQKMPMRKLGLALRRSRAYPFGWEKDYPAGYGPVPEKPGTLGRRSGGNHASQNLDEHLGRADLMMPLMDRILLFLWT